MANFNTHIVVAAATSGLASTVVLKAGYIDAPDALVLTLVGTIGGILPDVDLKYSYPSRIIFSFLGTFCALVVIFSVSRDFSVVELWGLGLLTFAVIRYPLWSIFHKLTVHRGALHSIVAGVFSCFLAAALSFHILGNSPFGAWLLAAFVFFGFMMHLILDELYSVDFMNHRVKRSFGSALKIIDMDKKLNSSMIVIATILIWQITPDISGFLEVLKDPQNKELFRKDFLPNYLLTLLQNFVRNF